MDVLFIIACSTAALAIFAPLILSIIARSVVKYSPYPYCFNLLSSASWIVYGARHHNTTACAINGTGVLANAVYMAAFLRFSARADHRRRYLICFLVGAVVVFAIIALVDVAGCHDLYDGLCSLVSVLVSLAPFINLLLVPRERLREAMPAPLVPATALLNAALWTWCNTAGVPLHDINLHLVIPSATSALCGFLLLGLHLVFWMQGPPPLPTGVYEPLVPQNQDESDQAAGRAGELRLNVESSTDNIITEDANRVLAPADVLKELIIQCEKEDGGSGRGGKLRSGVNSSTANGNIAIVDTSPEDAKRVPAMPLPTDALKALVSQPEMEDEGALRGGKLRLDAKLPEEGHAGNAVVDHTPVGTSNKDKESAEPHGDGAAA